MSFLLAGELIGEVINFLSKGKGDGLFLSGVSFFILSMESLVIVDFFSSKQVS